MEDFKIGDEVEVTNNDKFWGKYKKYNFYSYDENLDYPYLVKSVSRDGKTFVTSFKNCRKFKQRYRAYTEFNADWLREIIKNDDWEEWQIVGWKDGKVLLFNEVAYDNSDDDYCHKTVSLENLVKDYTKDGIPFGEEIK